MNTRSEDPEGPRRLVLAVRDPDLRERLQALLGSPAVEFVEFADGPRDDDACRETLLLLSSDTDRDVRNWATFGLGSLSEADTPEIREALSNRLADDDEEVRGEAMLGLAIRGDVRVVPLILAELEGDEVSSLTVQAAAEMPDRSYLPHLEELREANPEDEGIGLAVERCREE